MDIKVDNNEIINLDELTELVNNNKISYDALKNALNLLVNNPEYKDIINKEELIALLQKNVNKLENEKTNKEALQELWKVNQDFKRLTICETKKDSNDSMQNIDYLILEDDKHNVIGMIDFRFEDTINDFINNHSELISGWKGEDLFNYFAENVSKKMEIRNIDSEYQRDNENIDVFLKDSLNQDDALINEEIDELEKYKNDYGINEPIKVSVNYFNERIYTIGSGIFKFFTKPDGSRVMQTLKQPDLKKEYLPETIEVADDYNELMTELDGESLVEESIVDNNENKVVIQDSINYDNLDFSLNYGVFNKEALEKANEIYVKKNTLEEELTNDERTYYYSVCKKLVSDMIKFSQNPHLYENETNITMSEFKEYINEFVSPMVTNLKNVETPDLSNIEMKLASEYMINRENSNSNIKEFNKENEIIKDNIKIKKLNKAKENHGVSAIVILLEIIIVAMFVLMFLSLDI